MPSRAQPLVLGALGGLVLGPLSVVLTAVLAGVVGGGASPTVPESTAGRVLGAALIGLVVGAGCGGLGGLAWRRLRGSDLARKPDTVRWLVAFAAGTPVIAYGAWSSGAGWAQSLVAMLLVLVTVVTAWALVPRLTSWPAL